MLKILNFLWTGSWHDHEWETVKVHPVYSEYDMRSDKIPIGQVYVLRCKICGDITTKKIAG